ncbi:oligosaccharide flippase family protein [Photobacterium damselae]|uniref:oligosaccharide flippase family protein n=1 Tax=Photobacterium damselae TaxID=38293 RepID=UPI0040692D8B
MNLFKNQVVVNLLVSCSSFLSSIVISLLLVPYLVNHIGIAAYGFIPLAMFLTEYITLITQAITSSINRFFTLSYSRGNLVEAKKIFNTSLVIISFVSLLIFLIFIYPIYHPESFFNIGSDILYDVKWLFVLVFINFLISLITSVFNVALYAKNRVDYIQILNIIRVLIRFLFIIFLFNYSEVSLISVGIASVISGVIVFIISLFLFFHFLPDIDINIFLFDRKLIRNLLTFSSWLLISQLGFILFAKIDLLLVNVFFGDQKLGEYAVVSQLSSQLRVAFGVLVGVISPFILLKFTELKKNDFIRFLTSLYFIVSYLIFASLICLSVYSSDIIHFWIGDKYIQLSDILQLLLMGVGFMIAPTPLYCYINTIGKVKFAAIITVISGITNLALSIVLIKFTNLGYLAIALSSLIIIFARDFIIIPIYVFGVLNKIMKKYFFSLTRFCTTSILMWIISSFIGDYIIINSIYNLIITLILNFVILITIIGALIYFIEVKEIKGIFDAN